MARIRRLSPQAAAVLLALESGEWSHGYDLCRRLDLKAGTVYPVLIRLADRGLLDTAWEDAPPRGRPPRHLYRLSRDGVRVAAELREAARADARTPPARPLGATS